MVTEVIEASTPFSGLGGEGVTDKKYEILANKPIQDGGEAKAPLWLNRLSGTN